MAFSEGDKVRVVAVGGTAHTKGRDDFIGRTGTVKEVTETDDGVCHYVAGLQMRPVEAFMGLCAFQERELVRA